jgi:hypothetical protein
MRNLRWLTMLAVTLATILPLVGKLQAVMADPPGKTANEASDLELAVQRLLKDLAGDSRAQRVDAERQLRALGPRVLPHLPAPELLPSNSVREVVRRIRLELERAAANESVRPSRVTLDGTETLEDALAAITRQTGNLVEGRLLPAAMLQRTTGLQAKEIPFWQALDELKTRLDLRYEYLVRQRGLTLYPTEVENRPIKHGSRESVAGYADAFRVEALSATRAKPALDQGKEQKSSPRGDLLRFTLLVSPEPRLRPLFLQFAAKEITVQTQDNVDLLPLTPEANVELALNEGAGEARVQMDYIVPSSIKVSTVDLKGKLQCTAAAGNEVIRFAELRKLADGRDVNIARRRGGVTVALNRVGVSPAADGKKDLRISITVSYDTGGPAFETHRTWMLHNEVSLEDSAGRRLPLNGGSETTQQGNDGLGIIYRFAGLPDPLPEYTFVYVAPTMIVDVPIEFQIKSVPVRAKP